MKTLSAQQIRIFQETIWSHYKKYERKMPWRREKDPYKILVSEIMLQQTQVSRVISKYEEFVKYFPNFKSLADASLLQILTRWSGLGYNRRAKHLHELAKIIVVDYKGILPSDPTLLEELPGVGKATARSITVFTYNKPAVFIETNIRRVFIHEFFPKSKNVSDKNILSLVEATLPTSNPRQWYYALMDYGTHLATQVENPNRKSRQYIKQTKFSGSSREVRGLIIKLLIKQNKQKRENLIKAVGFETKRTLAALEGLMKDNIIEMKGKYVSIKSQ